MFQQAAQQPSLAGPLAVAHERPFRPLLTLASVGIVVGNREDHEAVHAREAGALPGSPSRLRAQSDKGFSQALELQKPVEPGKTYRKM